MNNNLIGMKLEDKIYIVMAQVHTEEQLIKLTGINERLAKDLMKAKRTFNTAIYDKMELVNVMKFTRAFDDLWIKREIVKSEEISENVLKNSLGLDIDEKIRYILDLPMRGVEIAKELGVSTPTVTILRSDKSHIKRMRLKTAKKFEKMFENYRTRICFETLEHFNSNLAGWSDYEVNNLVDKIRRTIREFRVGKYLMIDTRDEKTINALTDEKINAMLDDGERFTFVDETLEKNFANKYSIGIRVIERGADKYSIAIGVDKKRVPNEKRLGQSY